MNKITELIIRNLRESELDALQYFVLKNSSFVITDEIYNLWLNATGVSPEDFEKMVGKGLLEYNEEDLTWTQTDKAKTAIRKMRVINKDKSHIEQFAEFWKAYPASDKWASWRKTRILRNDKTRSMKLYKRALKEYSHEQLMKALEYDMELRKKASTSENRLKYMPGLSRWLNGQFYEAILEEMNQQTEEAKETVRYEGTIE